jgi:dolichol-phosphate mannosyltransferase
MLDGDGQHPVETALALVALLRQDPDLGLAQALRSGRQSGRLKNAASSLFYWTVNRIVPDVKIKRGAADFRAMRKPVVELLRRYPDRHRNLRVLLASLNLPTAYLEYEVAPRIAGASRYRFRQMLALATDGWFAFSSSPLRISLMMMLGSGVVGLAHLIYSLIVYAQNRTVPGWTSIIALISFLFSAVFGVLAIMSEYVARIYTDVRNHPIYRLRPDPGPGPDAGDTIDRAGGQDATRESRPTSKID